MARKQITVFATLEILEEVRSLTAARGEQFKYPPATTLNWYYDSVKIVEPAPLGKQRRRDPKDDPYLACTLADGATLIISRDDDLLALEKPFGIQILPPRDLLNKLARPLKYKAVDLDQGGSPNLGPAG